MTPETHGTNIRAMTLAADVADVLLSMGFAASESAASALALCECFCDRPVLVEVTASLITLAQERNTSGVPLVLVRPVQARSVNNMTIEAINNVVYDVEERTIDLDEAEARVHAIVRHPRRMPAWVSPLAAAGLSGIVVPLYSTSLITAVLAFVAGIVAERVLSLCLRRRIPPFFSQAIASAALTIAAAGLSLAAYRIPFLPAVNPTLVVVGGAIMLLSGLMFVGAFQDAIDEYYLTASARILKVIMMTAGIVIGVILGLKIVRPLGLAIIINPDPPALGSPFLVSTISAALIAAFYCWYCQSTLDAIIAAAITGAFTWVIFIGLWRYLEVGMLTSAFLAAVAAGLVAAFFARRWHIPTSAMTTAGIVTLVPGVMLMSGLMQLVTYPPGSPFFSQGLLTLGQALGVGLSVAGGASLGMYIGRPLKRRLQVARNRARKRNIARGHSPSSVR